METMSSFPLKNHLGTGCVYSRYFNILSGQEKEGVNDEVCGTVNDHTCLLFLSNSKSYWLSAMDFLDLKAHRTSFFSLRSQNKFYNFLVLIFFLFTSPSPIVLSSRGSWFFPSPCCSPPWEQHDLSFPGTLSHTHREAPSTAPLFMAASPSCVLDAYESPTPELTCLDICTYHCINVTLKTPPNPTKIISQSLLYKNTSQKYKAGFQTRIELHTVEKGKECSKALLRQ